MNKLFALAAAAVLTLSGCVVHTSDRVDQVVVVDNYIPEILDAEAGVFWDAGARDDVWYFDATVDDFDGPGDVVQVWADVYDDVTGLPVDSYPLDPTVDLEFWTLELYGSTTVLDPFYPYYSVDIVAYDSFDDYDIITVLPLTY
jgi:hypothetical protein